MSYYAPMTPEQAMITVQGIETARYLEYVQVFTLYPPPPPPPPPAKNLTLAQYLIKVEEWNRKELMPALSAGADY